MPSRWKAMTWNNYIYSNWFILLGSSWSFGRSWWFNRTGANGARDHLCQRVKSIAKQVLTSNQNLPNSLFQNEDDQLVDPLWFKEEEEEATMTSHKPTSSCLKRNKLHTLLCRSSFSQNEASGTRTRQKGGTFLISQFLNVFHWASGRDPVDICRLSKDFLL